MYRMKTALAPLVALISILLWCPKPVLGALYPNDAICGVMQTPVPKQDKSSYQFAGVVVPGSGVFWKARRRGTILQRLSNLVEDCSNLLKYKDTSPYRNDVCKDFLYRIFFVNEAVGLHVVDDAQNAIRHAAENGLVKIKQEKKYIKVTRKGILERLLNNYF
ncbi:hypothetical protein BdWA1_000516 [Babesia duncani]|uniref:Uncharacterized protein n=1 Tax=Babesia duncani TaxID=323732 RepID=A0AAD9UQ28_9APIC|nr:hypothetical protein BdWA1_000516 [Babesia duncani]